MSRQNLIQKIEVKPNSTGNKKNKRSRLLSIPKLEKKIQYEVWLVKKKLSNIMFLGTILFQLSTNYFLAQNAISININSNIPKILNISLGIIFGQIFAYMVDIISFNTSFIICVCQTLFCVLLNMFQQRYDSEQFHVFVGFLDNLVFQQVFFCIQMVIFNSYYDLKQRFAKNIFLQLVNRFNSLIVVILGYFDQKEIFTSPLMKSAYFVAFVVSSLIIFFSYGKIETIRSRSRKYQKYLVYQGMGLSLKDILRYFTNQNFMFILIIHTTYSFSYDYNYTQSGFTRLAEYYNLDLNVFDTLFGILIFIAFLIAFFISYCIISQKFIVETIMQVTKYLITAQIFLTFIKCLYYFFQNDIPPNLTLIICIIISLFSSINCALIEGQYYELVSCLNDENSVIKCQGYALLHNFGYVPVFVSLSIGSVQIIYFLQPLFLIILKIYSKKYLKNRSFIQLESNLRRFLEKQNRQFVNN